ncbi:MAG: fasciclin domain-containing protein [Ferruginibacter sp.]
MRLLLGVIFFVSCGGDDQAKPGAGAGQQSESAMDTSGLTIASNTQQLALDHLQSTGLFKQFTRLVTSAGMESEFTIGPRTYFIPNDSAFEKLATGVLSKWSEPSMNSTLKNILLNHVVEGAIDLSGQPSGSILTTLSGKPVEFVLFNGKAYLNKVPVQERPVAVSNGILYITHGILFPQKEKSQSNAKPIDTRLDAPPAPVQ